MDARHWMMEIEDYMGLTGLEDPCQQAAFACTYLTRVIRRRTQLMRTQADKTPEAWPTLEAELRMDRLRMRSTQKVQDFINELETIAQDLEWNASAICAAFRKCLTQPILSTIHMAYFNRWPDSFAVFKRAAQESENHIRMGKRALEENTYSSEDRRRVRFQSPVANNYENRRSTSAERRQ